MLTAKDIRDNPRVKALIEVASEQLEALGFTEHSYRHLGIVSENAGMILREMGYADREVELAKIAGLLHDIGNAVNRVDHAHTGAILAYNILTEMGMDPLEASRIMMAIGNHDENSGMAVSNISAALILADKSDVHRTRVREKDFAKFDIHDRVNFAVEKSRLTVRHEEKSIVLELQIDTDICPVMEYFEIFLGRMTMNRRAAQFFNYTFHLDINGTRLL